MAPSKGSLGLQRPIEKTLYLTSIRRPPILHLFGLISHALAKRPVQKSYKNQRFFYDFENALFVFISLFFMLDGPKGPSETPSGERSGDFGVPRTPLEIGEGRPWAPWAAPRATFRLLHIELLRKRAGPS